MVTLRLLRPTLDGEVLAAAVGVEALRGVDLDHLGAEIAEQGAAKGAGPDDGHVDDADAFEGQRRHQIAPCSRNATMSASL
jgi:hypothetical protein